MKTLTIKKIDANSDIDCRELRLLLAEKGHRAAARFQFGRYDPEQFWTIYVNGVLSYFSHSHLLTIGGRNFFRLGSKTTLLGKHLHLKLETQIFDHTIPKVRPALFYVATYHQILWTRKYNLQIPSIITLFDEKEIDCPDSHRITNLIENDNFYGFDKRMKEHVNVNKKSQVLYYVDEFKIEKMYTQTLDQFNVVAD